MALGRWAKGCAWAKATERWKYGRYIITERKSGRTTSVPTNFGSKGRKFLRRRQTIPTGNRQYDYCSHSFHTRAVTAANYRASPSDCSTSSRGCRVAKSTGCPRHEGIVTECYHQQPNNALHPTPAAGLYRCVIGGLASAAVAGELWR